MSTPAIAMDDAPVLVERLGHTLLVTLNRPHALNAVNAELSAAVGAALEEADHDRDVRAVVLAGWVFRLPEQLPRKIAMEMILTGDPIDAARALQLGLVNQVVAAADVVDAALALSERITVNAPLAVQASKRVALGIRDGRVSAEVTRWQHNGQEIRRLLATDDAKEGTRAFGENRRPQWQAR
jgi:enoyl-CoA hydratase/carnithine racemase